MLLPKKQSACIIIHAKERTRESFFLVFFLRTFIIIIILLSMSKRNAIKNVVCLFYRCSYALEFYHIWMKKEKINSVTKLSDFKLFVEGISSEDMSKN